MMRIEPISPQSHQAQQLLAQSDDLMASLYPAESNHMESATDLQQPNVLFVGALDQDQLMACGAAKMFPDDGGYGEIKRIFVAPAYRGRGISTEIMRFLETYLIDNGMKLSRLETGTKQPNALCLYHRLGYIERTPFGHYQPDPLSIFMEKQLG